MDDQDIAAEHDAPPASEPAPSKVEAVIAAWKQEVLHGSVVGHFTEAYNHLTTIALPELERRLKEAL